IGEENLPYIMNEEMRVMLNVRYCTNTKTGSASTSAREKVDSMRLRMMPTKRSVMDMIHSSIGDRDAGDQNSKTK
ncbi:hypothetical protein M413DRAFT_442287, partial [Hebeloma cylindrosporum]